MSRKANPLLPVQARTAAVLAALVPLVAAAREPIPLYLPDLVLVAGNWDSNATVDAAVVDLATGTLRVGWGMPGGATEWMSSVSAGGPGITAVATGPLVDAGRDDVLVTGPTWGRVLRFRPALAYGQLRPEALPMAGLGPTGLAVVDSALPGSDPALGELAVATAWNPGTDPSHVEILSHAGALPPLGVATRAAAPARVVGHALVSGGPAHAVLLERVDGGSRVSALDPANPASERFAFTVPAPGAEVTLGWFAGRPRVHVLLWEPGSSVLRASALEADLSAGPVVSLALQQAARAVAVIPHAGGDRIAVVSSDGGSLLLYAYDGASTLEVIDGFDAGLGQRFRGVLGGTGSAGMAVLDHAADPGLLVSRPLVAEFDGYALGLPNALPRARPEAARANLLLFAGEPFVDPAPRLLARLGLGEWTSDPEGAVAPGSLSVRAYSFLGDSAGLVVVSDPLLLGPTPEGATHALANQVRPDASIHAASPATGPVSAGVGVEPPPGERPTGFRVRFLPEQPGSVVRWSTDPATGAWKEAPGGLGPWVERETRLWYYAEGADPGSRTAVGSARWTIAGQRGEVDTDDDGVPDFVELAHGLDPGASGDDADGDGYSDLIELLNGTDPANPADPVADENNPPDPSLYRRFDFRATFDLVVRPRSPGGLGDPSDRFGPEPAGGATTNPARVRANLPSGRRLVAAEVTEIAPGDMAAELAGVAHASHGLTIVATGTRHALALPGPGASREPGRELAGAFAPPRLDLPPVPHEPGDGEPAAEAAAWVAAAIAYHESITRSTHDVEIDPLSTLAFAALEHVLGGALVYRGLAPSGRLSLLADRAGEVTARPGEAEPSPASRWAVPDASITALRRGPFGFDAWEPVGVHAALAAWLAAPTAEAALLHGLAQGAYEAAAAADDTAGATFPAPLDLFRSLLAGDGYPGTGTGPGGSDVGYAAALRGAFPEAAVEAALAALVAAPTPRPQGSGVVTVGPETFAGDYPVYRSVPGDEPVVLIAEDGRTPLEPAEAFALPPGTRLGVSGYLDRSGPGGETAIEVLSIEVASVPQGEAVDADDNLLPDSWELAFFGATGQGPLADPDEDGYSNLQELVLGTDPADGGLVPGVPAVDLGAPVLDAAIEDGVLKITWQYPPPYDVEIAFEVAYAAQLGDPWQVLDLPIIPLGGGAYEVSVPLGDGKGFYWVRLVKP